MDDTRGNLAHLWRAHGGLIGLLFVGLAISLLAVVAPQAWATPDHNPATGETTTSIFPPPDNQYPDCFLACDQPVYLWTVQGSFGNFDGNVTVYVTENITWTLGTTDVRTLNVLHQTTVQIVDGQFEPNPALIWDTPLEPGCFDVFFDVNGNYILDDRDGIINPYGPPPGHPCGGAGICVVACPVPVGGATLPPRLALIALGVVPALLVAAGAGFVWRRQRGRA